MNTMQEFFVFAVCCYHVEFTLKTVPKINIEAAKTKTTGNISAVNKQVDITVLGCFTSGIGSEEPYSRNAIRCSNWRYNLSDLVNGGYPLKNLLRGTEHQRLRDTGKLAAWLALLFCKLGLDTGYKVKTGTMVRICNH